MEIQTKGLNTDEVGMSGHPSSKAVGKAMNQPVYLDYNATTPVDPRVFDKMKPYFTEKFGNPSSKSHCYGWDADMAVQTARKQVAELIHCDPKDIIFTSGATESNNLVVYGITLLYQKERPHIITTAVEHKAVLEVCKMMECFGAEVTLLDVDETAQVSAADVEKAIRPNTKLISIIMANNEVGTLNPIKEIGELAESKGISFHTDAAQAAGKVATDVNDLRVDFLSISGHKMYGPKGVGALYLRNHGKKAELQPLICGGSQERGFRPGTLNVPGIVGLGEASSLANELMKEESQRVRKLRDHLIEAILAACPNSRLNGHREERLYNNASFSFEGLSSDVFALGLSGLAVSSGSACTSDAAGPSHVLKAMGLSDKLARSTIRLGLGRFTSAEDIELAIEKVVAMNSKNAKISNS